MIRLKNQDLSYKKNVRVKELSNLEQEIMSYIWQYRCCSVSQLHNKLKDKYAYTTIATISNRLLEKGVLVRKRQDRGFIYSPKITKIQYSKKIARTLISTFLSSYGDSAFVSFAESIEELPVKQRDRLLSILKKKIKTK